MGDHGTLQHKRPSAIDPGTHKGSLFGVNPFVTLHVVLESEGLITISTLFVPGFVTGPPVLFHGLFVRKAFVAVSTKQLKVVEFVSLFEQLVVFASKKWTFCGRVEEFYFEEFARVEEVFYLVVFDDDLAEVNELENAFHDVGIDVDSHPKAIAVQEVIRKQT